VRLLMKPPLSARLPLEMLDRVGEINVGSFQSDFMEDLIKKLARGTHEGSAGKIFIIPGNFADHQHARMRRALAEYRLRPRLPQWTGLAAGRGITQPPK